MGVAEKDPAYCQHLWPGLLLPTLLDTLALSDTEVVGQSLELLQLLFLYQPGVPKLMSIESVMSPSHLILCRPLLLLPPIPPELVFSNESTLRMSVRLFATP